MSGDQTLFLSSGEIRSMWQFLAPMLDTWEKAPQASPLRVYPDGTPGPAQAEELIKKDGRDWV
jgi:glucose-6-phosphate 1-dehydrogenase